MTVIGIRLSIGLVCVALIGCLVALGRIALILIADGRAAVVGLGVALLVLPVVGLWAIAATLRAGFAHQKLVRLATRAGMDLDVSSLPRRGSGRIERVAADPLVDTVRTELEADPDNWMRWYRLARAYDCAGDRGRARRAMRRAVELQECR